MKQIINKVAYWGNHTFEATSDNIDGKNVIRIDVLRNFPSFARIHEGTFFVENKRQLVKLSDDEKCALRFFTGSLSGCRRKDITITRKNKNGREVQEKSGIIVPTIDEFIECFKYNIKQNEKE